MASLAPVTDRNSLYAYGLILQEHASCSAAPRMPTLYNPNTKGSSVAWNSPWRDKNPPLGEHLQTGSPLKCTTIARQQCRKTREEPSTKMHRTSQYIIKPRLQARTKTHMDENTEPLLSAQQATFM